MNLTMPNAPSADEQAPLLGPASGVPAESSRDGRPAAGETTPLLARPAPDDDDGSGGAAARPAHAKLRRRWPSIAAITVLVALSLAIVVVAFFVPAAVEEYAKQGTVLEPTNLSLESITADGVRARIQANFRLDGSRVKNEHVRRIGRATTWVVRRLGTEKTTVQVYLPEYGNTLLGSAAIPPLVVDLVDGHTTPIDFVADLVPGDAEGIRGLANQWLEGRLDAVRLQGRADIELKTGFVPLGTHSVSETLVLEGQYLYRSFASLYFGEKSIA